MSKKQHQAQFMAQLDQYAQESGFANLADLKNNYTEQAYRAVLTPMMWRAMRDVGIDDETVNKCQNFMASHGIT